MCRVRQRTFRKQDPFRHVSVCGKEPVGKATQEVEGTMEGATSRGWRSKHRMAPTSHVCTQTLTSESSPVRGGHAAHVTGAERAWKGGAIAERGMNLAVAVPVPLVVFIAFKISISCS